MTKGQRTVVSLLAVIAVLLGLNLLSDPPEAEAQVEEGVAGACCLPDGSCEPGQSEVGCLKSGGIFHGVGTVCVSFDCTIPRVVSVTVAKEVITNPETYRVFRGWSNGDVDMMWVDFGPNPTLCDVPLQCGPVPIIPPPCPADVNDDLSVNVLDLIELLLAFGSTCPAAG